MNELIAQLKRIANSLEEQNRLYVERCAQDDTDAQAEEIRRFQHDFEVVKAQSRHRAEQLKLELENIQLICKLYAAHPEHMFLHAAALNKALDKQSQPDDSTSEG